MKLKLLSALMLAAAAGAITVTLDADASEWVVGGTDNVTPEEPIDETVSMLYYRPYEAGSYELSVYWTYDDEYISVAIDRNTTKTWYNDSYFVIAVDVDNTADSGATHSPTNLVDFEGTYRPDYVFYTIDENNPNKWDDLHYDQQRWDEELQQWVDCDVNVGVSMVGEDSEFSIKATDFCVAPLDTLRIWVYEVSKSDGSDILFTADGMTVTVALDGHLNLGDGILAPVPEPCTMALLGLGGLFLRRKA